MVRRSAIVVCAIAHGGFSLNKGYPLEGSFMGRLISRRPTGAKPPAAQSHGKEAQQLQPQGRRRKQEAPGGASVCPADVGKAFQFRDVEHLLRDRPRLRPWTGEVLEKLPGLEVTHL